MSKAYRVKKALRKLLKVVLIITAIIILFVIISLVHHKICSSKEKDLLTPLGELVEVNGHNMSIYTEGEGNKTLVFLSGGGTCSPILDFKSLYSLLSSEYKIVVVEKLGYGFSDVVEEKRDIDTILSETRMALDQAGIQGPYVLCPHSLSGLEALYWAQKYPDEVEAIVGLDMAVPAYYDEMDISIPMMKLGHYGAVWGITRWIPSLAESDAIKYGTLSEKEKEIYRAVFYQRTATETMIDEAKVVKDNANIVKENGGRLRQSDEDLEADFVTTFGRLSDGSSPAKLPGISIDNSAYNTIVNNNVTQNYGSGVKMVRSAYRNIIMENSVSDNNKGKSDDFHFFGIEIGHESTPDEPVKGLDFTASYENIVCRNIVTGSNYAGVFLAVESYCNDVFDNTILGSEWYAIECHSNMFNSMPNNIMDQEILNLYAR